jgi:hypothetical protein
VFSVLTKYIALETSLGPATKVTMKIRAAPD